MLKGLSQADVKIPREDEEVCVMQDMSWDELPAPEGQQTGPAPSPDSMRRHPSSQGICAVV